MLGDRQCGELTVNSNRISSSRFYRLYASRISDLGPNRDGAQLAAAALRRLLLLVICAPNVFGLEALGALLDVELDFFAFVQGSVSGRLDGAVMDEDVLTAFALDKSVAFVVVEPLDCTDFGHRLLRPKKLEAAPRGRPQRGLFPNSVQCLGRSELFTTERTKRTETLHPLRPLCGDI